MSSKSYTITWLPLPGPLFSKPETATGIDYIILCQIVALPPDPLSLTPVEPVPVVESYSIATSPEPPSGILTIMASAATGVHVSAEKLSGLFGIEFIDYLQNKVIARIADWNDLPAEAEEIVEFRPSSEQFKQYTMTITAELSNKTTESAGYTMTITQEWTAGRDRLRKEINARSSKIGG